MAITEIFTVGVRPQVLQPDIDFIATPKGFDHLGAVGEDEGQFDDWCRAIRIVSDECDQATLEAISVLMNRAAAYGAMQARRAA